MKNAMHDKMVYIDVTIEIIIAVITTETCRIKFTIYNNLLLHKFYCLHVSS